MTAVRSSFAVCAAIALIGLAIALTGLLRARTAAPVAEVGEGDEVKVLETL